MKRIVIKSAFAIVCIVAASVSCFKAYDQHNKNVAAANMLLAENVEALSDGDSWISNAWNSVTGAVSDWYNSKVYSARTVTVQVQTGANVSAGAPVYGIVINVGGNTSTTVTYQCNCCVNGTTFAHCSEIPNLCSSDKCRM